MIVLNLFLVAFLIALSAVFVASEFAIIRVRSTRIDQLIETNVQGAIAVKKVISHLDEYLSACQLGITITSLGLGWLGEPTVEWFLKPIFKVWNLNESVTNILSFTIAFTIITFLHVVVGELAPKTVAIEKAEQVSLFLARPLILFYKIMFPFIWVLNSSARQLTAFLGLELASEHEIAHSEEELRIILSESYKSGQINQSEYKYVNRIFEFDNRIAKEIMVPRTEMVAISQEATLDEILTILRKERYTRYPVYLEDKDNIVGIVNMKDILTDCIQNRCKKEDPLTAYIKPVIHVIDSIPIHDLLPMLQKDRSHLAILFDEYGGTSGLVTVEDILEEIVGEIRDEFDIDEIPLIQKIAEDHYIFDAKLLISEVNDLLGTSLDEEDVDTIGGWLLTQKFELREGDFIEADGYTFIVKEIEGHHLFFIEVKRL